MYDISLYTPRMGDVSKSPKKEIEMKFGLIIPLCAFLVLLGCDMGQGKKDKKDQKDKKADIQLVRAMHAKRGQLSARLEITARVEALEQTEIIPRVEGTVIEVLVDEGSDVKSGQILARIEDDEARIKVAAQRLAVEQTKVAVSMAKLSRDESAAMLQTAETTLTREINERDRALAQHKRGAISDKDNEAAEFVYTKAVADKEQAALKFKRSQEDILRTQIDEKTAKNTLQAEQLKLSFCELKATIAGRLTQRNIRTGQRAALGQSAFLIADLDSLVVRARIPETDIRVLKIGLKVNLDATAYPGVKYTGVVDLIASEVDTDGGQINVRIRINQSEPPLRPGMFVSGHIVTEIREDSLLIPKKALLFDRDRPYIYVVERNADSKTVKKIYIRRGLQNSTEVEYLPLKDEEAKVNDDTEIVVVGLDRLTDGAQITIEGEKASEKKSQDEQSKAEPTE
ncbi:MAG: RND family efflux transporter MFP subunit [Planctomycetota bacterium]|jgi:RND family efflux transporter MFP subunit